MRSGCAIFLLGWSGAVLCAPSRQTSSLSSLPDGLPGTSTVFLGDCVLVPCRTDSCSLPRSHGLCSTDEASWSFACALLRCYRVRVQAQRDLLEFVRFCEQRRLRRWWSRKPHGLLRLRNRLCGLWSARYAASPCFRVLHFPQPAPTLISDLTAFRVRTRFAKPHSSHTPPQLPTVSRELREILEMLV